MPTSRNCRPFITPIDTVYKDGQLASPILPPMSISDTTNHTFSPPHTPISSILQPKLFSALFNYWSLEMIPYLCHSDPPMISLSLSELELSLLLPSMALYILMADFRFSLDPLYHSLTLLISEVILHTSSLADDPGCAWLVLLSLQVPPHYVMTWVDNRKSVV